jgi:hypothetical protein
LLRVAVTEIIKAQNELPFFYKYYIRCFVGAMGKLNKYFDLYIYEYFAPVIPHHV